MFTRLGDDGKTASLGSFVVGIEHEAVAVAFKNVTVDDKLLVLREVAVGQTDVVQLVAPLGCPGENPVLRVPRDARRIFKRCMHFFLCIRSNGTE